MPEAPTTHERPGSEPPHPAGATAGTSAGGPRSGAPLGKFFVLVVVVCLVLGGSWWMNRGGDDFSEVAVAAGNGKPPVTGEPATDFSATTTDGAPFSLSAHRGTPVWLSFVATWCSSCRTEAPDIQAAWEESAQDVIVASVYLGESSSAVTTWADRLGTTYPQIPDPQKAISARYGIMAVPSHVFIDGDGQIHSTHVGILTRDEMTDILQELAND